MYQGEWQILAEHIGASILCKRVALFHRHLVITHAIPYQDQENAREPVGEHQTSTYKMLRL